MQQAADRVHFTHLKSMADSPAHYVQSVKDGFESPAFRFGRLVHYLTLGGIEDEHYAVYQGEKNRSSNEYKDFVKLAKSKGIEKGDVFKIEEVVEAQLIANAVKADPVVRRLGLLEGEKELLVDWDNAGVPFRSHLDVLGVASMGVRKGRRHLVDLKTTTCSKPDKFHWEARRFAYHAQLGTYDDAARFIKQPVDDHYVIAVEKGAPFCVVVYSFTPELLGEGKRLTRGWLERYRICQATNEWPGYVQDVERIDVLRADEQLAGPPLLLTMHDGTEVAA